MKIKHKIADIAQISMSFLPRYANWSKRFNRTLPLDLRYHHCYQVRRIGSEAHRWAIENNWRFA